MNNDFIHALMNMAAFILAGSVHEWAHGFSAFLMGDNTARDNGRMTINPAAHVDLLGTVILPLFRAFTGVPVLGWMKPVPVNPYNFRDSSKGMALSAIAGPLSNIFQAALSIVLMRLIMVAGVFFKSAFFYSLYDFVSLYYIINISLVLFNLLPIPPLDGSKVLRHGLSDEGKMKLDKVSRYGGIALYILLLAGLFRVVLTPILSWSYVLLYHLFAMNFFWSFLPLAAVSAVAFLLFGNYLGPIRRKEISPALFHQQISRIREKNESLKKTALLLLEKKAKGTLNTMIDKKLLIRIEEGMDNFTRLCTTRTIDPHEEVCLDCSYYANCLMRELNLTVVRGEEH